MIKLKICGLTNLDDARRAEELGADFLGMVFAPSVRRIDLNEAEKITRGMPQYRSFVGVFVNEKEDNVIRTAESLGLRLLQFHGDESAEYCLSFVKKGFHVIKALAISSYKDLTRLKKYDVPYYLFDASSSKGRGGTGESFDWAVLEAPEIQNLKGRLFISGGLTPDNLPSMLKRITPYAVDVSSGVEKSPGRKDPALMDNFIKTLRKSEKACLHAKN
ncbi:MAG: phosphoribosylanthranilate isomerase [Candidatus Omnitrophica bacterium]|nr:phosphoribosylanthranilate isomerase [Candidatus Omnitrophota bacterium]